MKKFIFKMQGILSIREKVEEQAKATFGAALAKLHEEEEKRDAIQKRIDEYRIRLNELVSGVIDIKKISACESALDVLDEQLKNAEIYVKRAEKQVELARARLNNATIDRKGMEILKEKAFAEYMEEIKAEERKEVDELISYRHGRDTDE